MKIEIDENNSRGRLDKFLAKKFGQFSRRWLQKLIKEGEVLVNNQKVKPNYILKINDEVVINLKKPPKISLKPDPNIKINIVYEDSDLLIINKSAGVVVHPSQSVKSGTLINGLLAIRPEIKDVGDTLASLGQGNFRPGILHRLDKETSGLLIVAKNNKTFRFLKKQFKDRKIVKKYLALVVGRISKNRFLIDLPIVRSKFNPTKQRVVKSLKDPLISKAKCAKTKIKVLEKFDNYTLIEAQPITGRMHQIRVHLAAIGYPIVGDEKYGKGFKNKFLGLKRNFLHAYYLKFKKSNKQIFELKIDLPDELKKILKFLKSEAH